MKVTVKIHTAHGLEIKKVKVRRGNKLRLRKDWEPKLIDYEVKHLWFGRAKYFADIWENAKETWSYKTGLTPENQPELSQSEVTRYAKAKIWERRYAGEPKATGNWIGYITLIAVIGGIIFNYLITKGILRI